MDAARKPAATYSGGMRRRLDIAMGLVADPQVLFLDEPTTGLDPRSRRGVWRMIRELVANGTTVFLTTQYLEEADQLADRIALPMLLMILPFFGSGFVPTDSMPAWLGWLAGHQPFTPVMETLRGLLLGTPIGDNAWIAVGWCVLITVLSFLGAKKLMNREPR